MKRCLVFVALVVSVIGAVACEAGPAATSTPHTTATATVETSGTPLVTAPGFSHPLKIDNKWSPMVPGTASYYSGTVSQDRRQERHGIVSIVTDLTKVIDGVSTRVVWERDFSNGVVEESEILFVAQDDTGTVWLFGEYPAVYEGGKFTGAPSTWLAGVDGARRGTFMLADPRVGAAAYSEGLAPSVEFDDRGKVYKVGQSVYGVFDTYRDVLVIDEWSPLAPEDGHQLKYYAAGVGSVFVTPKGGDQQEALSIVNVVHLGDADMAETRRNALQLDTDAYKLGKVWAQTSPAWPAD
jgi:hypothetical protein